MDKEKIERLIGLHDNIEAHGFMGVVESRDARLLPIMGEINYHDLKNAVDLVNKMEARVTKAIERAFEALEENN